MKQLQKKLDYKWVIVVACFAMIFVGLGFCSGNKSLFLAAVTEALHIPRGVYAVGDSIRYVVTSVTNLFFGFLVIKLGPRKLVGIGMLSLALSNLINALAENVYVLYLGSVFLGLGFTFGSTTIVGYVINIWCKEKKGTIMGLVLCANGLGSGLSAQWFSSMIYNGDPFGYRTAYQSAALILLIAAIVLVAVFRDAPKDQKELPAAEKKKAKGSSWEGITLAQALKTPYFYIACACIFCTGAVLQSVTGVSSAHLKDQGFAPEFVATIASVSHISLAICKFSAGFLYDKKGLKFTVLLCDAAAILMISLLSIVTNSPVGQGISYAYAVLASMALPLETIMLPLIAGELFGQREYPKLLGIFVSVNTAGYAVGPLVSNICFDMIGTYRPVFWVYAGIMVVVTAAFLYVLRKVDATRKALAAQ